MLQGPNYIYKCPNCDNILRKGSLMSGNTFGAKIFSDGKRIAPMNPEFPDITKCKKCNTIFWLSKLKEIGTFEWGDIVQSNWENADNAEFLNIEDYFRYLNEGHPENEQEESFIRQLIWWAYNDKKREGQELFIDESDQLRWAENVQKLKKLFNQSDINQKIMIAEMSRNLGDFENCISIIQSIENDDLIWLKEKFINECKRKNKWVIVLN